MSEERYDLIFRGELARGADLAQAKRNIAQLFKVDGEKVERLFSGQEHVLKKGVDFDTASKYRGAIKKAGCLVDVREIKAVVAEPARAVFKLPDEPNPASPAPAPVPAAESNSKTEEVPPAAVADVHFDVAPAGEELLHEDEREPVVVREVDISSLSLKAGGDLLDESEKAPEIKRDIQLDASLAPVGEALLHEDEREHVVAVQVDLSDLSIAEAGADLGQEKDQKTPLKPDISHLHLV